MLLQSCLYGDLIRYRFASVISDKYIQLSKRRIKVAKENKTEINYEVNMKEKYESLSLAVLKELAKARGMRGISTMKKGELIDTMLLQDEKDKAEKQQGE